LAMARNIWGILALVLITAIGFYAGLGMAAAGFLFFLCVVIQAIRGDLWSATIVATVAAFALACFFSPTIFLFSAAGCDCAAYISYRRICDRTSHGALSWSWEAHH